MVQYLPETLRQVDIRYADSLFKERGYFVWRKSGDTTTYFRDKERQFGMFLGATDKVVDVRLNFGRSSVHGRDAVSLSL